jgi:hypothetical protein
MLPITLTAIAPTSVLPPMPATPLPLVVLALLGLTATALALGWLTGRRRAVDPVPPGADAIDAYRAFLAAHDGAVDLRRGTLVERERFFERLERHPVCSARPVDAEAFRRNQGRLVPERGLDARTLWVIATADTNQAERWGVGLSELLGRFHPRADPVALRVMLQERYHTRILAELVETFGVSVRPLPPPLPVRLLIRLMLALPERATLPLVGASEMAGCVVFRLLRDRGVTLFADEPAVAARIRLLYDEILADELGHVGWIAARLGPRGRRVMRGLYRALGELMVVRSPAVTRLCDPGDVRRALATRFDAQTMARELPGRAFVAVSV